MLNYSEIYRVIIENRDMLFEDKKALLEQENKALFYQLVKYLYNNHNSTSETEKDSGFFSVSVMDKAGPASYRLPVPMRDWNESDPAVQLPVGRDYEYVDNLDKAICKIAEYNISNQDFPDEQENIRLVACEDAIIPAFGSGAVKTEIEFKLLTGYEAIIYGSPGLSKGKIQIADQFINSEFDGVITVKLKNESDSDYMISRGDIFGRLVSRKIPFEMLEGVRHNTGKKRTGENHPLGRKTRFIKSEISHGIKSQLTGKGFSRMRVLLLGYALKMNVREVLALLQADNENPSINIWDGYETAVFYAIVRKEKDITLNDLDDLGLILSQKKDNTAAYPVSVSVSDTDAALECFNALSEMNRQDSLTEIKKLLAGIAAENKSYSIRVKAELDSLFRAVMEGSEKIFKGNYWKKCLPDDKDEESFTRCRNAITEQFWPYYGKQFRHNFAIFNNLQSLRSLPHKNHLKAVDNNEQPVTKADLEFAFFLKFALENPLSKYGSPETADLKEMMDQRCSDYRLQVNNLMFDYHFTEVHDMDPFDGLLLVCMQKEYPIKTLHSIAEEYFDLNSSAEIHDI